MLLKRLTNQKLLHPPAWLPDNTVYLCQMGSVAYGVSGESSDVDVYGFAVPPKEMTFPHLGGEVFGFGTPVEKFNTFQQHKVFDPSTQNEYDVVVYSIVKFFQLCMDNNPNMIDALFVPDRCVLHATGISNHVRAHRQMFLHKGAFKKFKGYAYGQLEEIKKRTPSNPKRAADVEKYGYDTKFGYHLVRIACECEQILIEHDLNLEANSEQLKSIRRGEWTLERVEAWFIDKEKALETLYVESTLPAKPDEAAIKKLLLECLEMHYGSLDTIITKDQSAQALLADLEVLVQKYR